MPHKRFRNLENKVTYGIMQHLLERGQASSNFSSVQKL